MGKKAEYRSAIRSRRLIREAFVELLKEKKFYRITVTDIVTRADINRGTFYAHYADTRGILEELEEESLSQFKDLRYQEFFRNPMPMMRKISDWLAQDPEFYRTLLNSGGSEHFLGKLSGFFFQQMLEDTSIPQEIRESSRFRLQAYYISSGIIGTYQSWFRGELDVPLEAIPEQLVPMIQNAAELIYAGSADADEQPAVKTEFLHR